MPITVSDIKANADTAFPKDEYATRLHNVRQLMQRRQLDALLVTKPENIFYLTGLDHQGYFAFHLLIVPIDGDPFIVARAMEWATMANQLPETQFVGYQDGEGPAPTVARLLQSVHVGSGNLGVEMGSLYYPPATHAAIVAARPDASWLDESALVDGLRLVKSPREIEYTRQAARVSDAMMTAALETVAPGVNETALAAVIYDAMILGGGDYPGFVPFIRSGTRIAEEHTTWRNRTLEPGTPLMLEMAGCVARYHAPQGRYVQVGGIPAAGKNREARQICLDAFQEIVDAIRPGRQAREVYSCWQRHIERAGIENYRRHHCGYLTGIGYPPAWTGGGPVIGLRHDSTLELVPGMVFHAMSWLLGSNKGDYFISNTVVLTDKGSEVLTRSPAPLVAA